VSIVVPSVLPRLLIVDDNPSIIHLLATIFADDYNVSFATNGQKALELIKNEKPCVILLDVMMPELDGYELCKQLKSDPQTETIPIIFITAKSTTEDEIQALNLGAADFITKPISPTIAKMRVKNQIKHAYSQKFSTIAIDSLAFAMLIVDSQGTVNYANAHLLDLLDTKIKGLAIKNGQLVATTFNGKQKLHEFIQAATQFPAVKNAMFINEDNQAWHVFITPLPPTLSLTNTMPTPLALIYISNANNAFSELDMMGKLYDLTPAELRVASALVAGKSPSQYAHEVGLTMNTVRTQLKNLYSKTYTHRQSELVALLSKTPPLKL
jgi:DNA-binding response OmpR family regulator/DNA-binding CsgD family transcriptional regulator